jgi:hypothetical protein
MTMRGVVEGSTPAKHSVRVDWFRRDPGGTTIFVLPGDDGVASQPATEHNGDVPTQG